MIFKDGSLGLRWLQSREIGLSLAPTGKQTERCYDLQI